MLVDTNVISELMRPRPDARVLAWSRTLDRIALSVITLEDLWFGIARRPSPRMERWLSAFLLEHVDVVPVTALERRLVLATRNVADFERCGVRVVNPFDA